MLAIYLFGIYYLLCSVDFTAYKNELTGIVMCIYLFYKYCALGVCFLLFLFYTTADNNCFISINPLSKYSRIEF